LDGLDYNYWAEANVKSKFWGKSLEIHPLGLNHVRLPLYTDITSTASGTFVEMNESEHYSWRKVTTTVNNLIVGTLTIDHSGSMVIKNWRTNDECTIVLKKKDGGWFGGGSAGSTGFNSSDPDSWTLTGNVKDPSGRIRFELRGRWDECLEAVPVPDAVDSFKSPLMHKPFIVWKRHQLPAISRQNFNFTSFALCVNQIDATLRPFLPLTDSRLRPDQTAMESGLWELANKSKEQLETYQRGARKLLVANYEKTGIPSGPTTGASKQEMTKDASIDGDSHAGPIEIGEPWWTPRWFVREVEPDTQEEHWHFNQEYWKHRKEGVWPDYVLDIFGLRQDLPPSYNK